MEIVEANALGQEYIKTTEMCAYVKRFPVGAEILFILNNVFYFIFSNDKRIFVFNVYDNCIR